MLISLLVVLGLEIALFLGGRFMAPPFLETLHQKQNHQLSAIQIETISDPIAIEGHSSFYLVSDAHYMYVIKSNHAPRINQKIYGYSQPYPPQLKQITLESINTMAQTQVVTPETFDEMMGLYYLDAGMSPFIILILLTTIMMIALVIFNVMHK